MAEFDRNGFEDAPKGYPPLELTFREGHYYLPDGARLVSDFKIGPEEHHKQLFIEYERSFGRGNAFDITHGSGINPMILKRYGGMELQSEYREIANHIRPVAYNGSKEEAERMIESIKAFRKKYAALYKDVT